MYGNQLGELAFRSWEWEGLRILIKSDMKVTHQNYTVLRSGFETRPLTQHDLLVKFFKPNSEMALVYQTATVHLVNLTGFIPHVATAVKKHPSPNTACKQPLLGEPAACLGQRNSHMHIQEGLLSGYPEWETLPPPPPPPPPLVETVTVKVKCFAQEHNTMTLFKLHVQCE